MAIDLSSLTSGVTALQNVILVSPQNVVGYQPENQVGQPYNAPPLLFHYEGEQTATIESDITDHYVEDNTAIQDQIAIKPVIVTTHGFIGELNDVAPIGLQTLQVAANKLVSIGNYTPGLSTTALLAYNEAAFAYQTIAQAANAAIASARSLTNFITGGSSGGENVISGTNITNLRGQNLQQSMFQQFFAYQVARTLFTVQTPWAVFQHMAIKSLRAIQDAETDVITDFEVSFKQIRFASTQTTQAQVDPNTRLGPQTAQAVNLGTSALNPSTTVFSPSGGQ